jgi:ubiquinone/menaquinone biosynthesis C-methylase UbiE
MKKILHPVYIGLFDSIDWAQRLKNGKTHWPPRSLRDVGDSDFEATGLEFVNHFKRLCQLQPDATVLEIGCGCGRIAMPLTQYIQPPGRYYGVDVVKSAINWCQKHISQQHPHFQFVHADLYNKRYNPDAAQLAKDYHFPFENHKFDFIYLTSVFTHLLPADMQHYLDEIVRLLKDDGLIFGTFFLLNENQQKHADMGLNQIDFKFEHDIYRIRNQNVPESAVAYDENYIFRNLRRCGFRISQPIYYGSWSGHRRSISFQDFIIAHSTAFRL